jgi:hypothetical protein
VKTQAKKNPNIALRLIEKLAPEEFGERKKLEMTGKLTKESINIDIQVDGTEVAKRLTTEQLRQLRGHRLKQIEAGEVQVIDDDEE